MGALFDIMISPDHVFYKTFFVFVVFSTLLTSGGWLIRLSSHDPSPAASQGTNSLALAKATAEKSKCKHYQNQNGSTQVHFLTPKVGNSLVMDTVLTVFVLKSKNEST